MQENQTDLLPYKLIQHNAIPRKKLLPLWIKIFAWIFLVISAFVPIVLVLGLIGYNAQLALYGLETNEPVSSLGIIITTSFIIKGVTAFGLLKEKRLGNQNRDNRRYYWYHNLYSCNALPYYIFRC